MCLLSRRCVRTEGGENVTLRRGTEVAALFRELLIRAFVRDMNLRKRNAPRDVTAA